MSGLFDTDADGDIESVNDEVEHVDNVADSVSNPLCDIIPETVELAHADNREDAEAEDESNAVLVAGNDWAGDWDVDGETIDDNDIAIELVFVIDCVVFAVVVADGETIEDCVINPVSEEDDDNEIVGDEEILG